MNVISNYFDLNEMEIVHQIERMHAYPPAFYRFANILEKRPESIILHKLEKYFFDLIDTSKFSQNPNNFFIFILIVSILLIFRKFLCDQKKS